MKENGGTVRKWDAIKTRFRFLTVDGYGRLRGERGLHGRVFRQAPDDGAVVGLGHGQGQPGDGHPRPGLGGDAAVLLGVAGHDLAIAGVPPDLGGRVAAGDDALELELLAGGGDDLAALVAHALDVNVGRRFWGKKREERK